MTRRRAAVARRRALTSGRVVAVVYGCACVPVVPRARAGLVALGGPSIMSRRQVRAWVELWVPKASSRWRMVGEEALTAALSEHGRVVHAVGNIGPRGIQYCIEMQWAPLGQ